MKFNIFLVGMLLAVASWAGPVQQIDWSKVCAPLITGTSDHFATAPVLTMVITSGSGSITIHFDTGQVELMNTKLPEAAMLFWKTLTDAYPQFRQSVIKGGP